MQLRRSKWLGIALVGGLTAIVACSSEATIESGGSFGRAGGVNAVGSASAPPAAPPRCPADPPAAGTSCAGSGTYCTYGPDLRDECVETYECGSRWLKAKSNCAFECPKTFAEIVPGTTCGDIDMACSYDEGTCGCTLEGPPPAGTDAGFDAGANDAGTDGGDGGLPWKPLIPGVWKCVAPPADARCPSARPRVLDACVIDVTCDYGSCELDRDLSYRCNGKYWQEPISADSCER